MTRLTVITNEEFPAAPLMAENYLESLQLLDRLHRLMLDLIKDEFERMGVDDLSPVQALLIFNLGRSEVTAGELRSRGMYQGSNVSYNLKKLVQMGYLTHHRCDADKRSIRVRLTQRGEQIRDMLAMHFMRHAAGLEASGVLDDPDIGRVNKQWRRIERYWNEQIRYIY